jgi:Subtilase family
MRFTRFLALCLMFTIIVGNVVADEPSVIVKFKSDVVTMPPKATEVDIEKVGFSNSDLEKEFENYPDAYVRMLYAENGENDYWTNYYDSNIIVRKPRPNRTFVIEMQSQTDVENLIKDISKFDDVVWISDNINGSDAIEDGDHLWSLQYDMFNVDYDDLYGINIESAWFLEMGNPNTSLVVNESQSIYLEHYDIVNKVISDYVTPDGIIYFATTSNWDSHPGYSAGIMGAHHNNDWGFQGGVKGIHPDGMLVNMCRKPRFGGDEEKYRRYDGLATFISDGHVVPVINNSWGLADYTDVFDPQTDPIEDDIHLEMARLAQLHVLGTLVVGSSGNFGTEQAYRESIGDYFPFAHLPATAGYWVMNVGSYGLADHDDPRVTLESQWSSGLDILAPGGGETGSNQNQNYKFFPVLAAPPSVPPGSNPEGFRFTVHGTSLAAPHVSGVAGLVRDHAVDSDNGCDYLTPAEIQAVINHTARTPQPGTVNIEKYGNGYLDAFAAVTLVGPNSTISQEQSVKGQQPALMMN